MIRFTRMVTAGKEIGGENTSFFWDLPAPEEGMLEKGIFEKGFLEAGKETVALGAGGLLHRGQHRRSVGGSGQKGLCFCFTGMARVDSPPLRSRNNWVRGSGVKGWQDLKETRCYFP